MRNGVLASKFMVYVEIEHTREEMLSIEYMNLAMGCIDRKENSLGLDYLRRAKSYISARSKQELVSNGIEQKNPYTKMQLSLSYLRDGLYDQSLAELKLAEDILIEDVASKMNLPSWRWQ